LRLLLLLLLLADLRTGVAATAPIADLRGAFAVALLALLAAAFLALKAASWSARDNMFDSPWDRVPSN
jgi:hypothetical protein